MVGFVNRSSHETTTGTNGSRETIVEFLLGQLRCDFLSSPIISNKKRSLRTGSASAACGLSQPLSGAAWKSSLWLLFSFPPAPMFPSSASDAVPSLPLYICSGKRKERHPYSLNHPPKSVSLLYRIILYQPHILQLLCVLTAFQHNRNIQNIHPENRHWS